MRIASTGRVQSQESIARRSKANTGKIRSEETKAKMREAWVRRKRELENT
jgi:hypothetical protein